MQRISLLDDDPDRSAEDRSPAAPGAGSPQNRPLLGVWGRGALAPRGCLRAHCPLASLHLVRNRQCGAALPRQQDRLAGRLGPRHPAALQQQPRRALHQVQVCHRALLHLHQPHQRRIWECRAQHQHGESFCHRRHASWM